MKAAVVIAVTCTVAGFVAWAAGQGAVAIGGIRLPFIAAALAFAVQWVAFIPAYIKQTERFYDLTGSITYLVVTWIMIVGAGNFDVRSLVLGALIHGGNDQSKFGNRVAGPNLFFVRARYSF